MFLSHVCSATAIVSPATLVPDTLFRVWSKFVCLFLSLDWYESLFRDRIYFTADLFRSGFRPHRSSAASVSPARVSVRAAWPFMDTQNLPRPIRRTCSSRTPTVSPDLMTLPAWSRSCSDPSHTCAVTSLHAHLSGRHNMQRDITVARIASVT